jgi:hypothetical protein
VARWDCTLHVFDRASLARFSARFLRGMHKGSAFDEEYDGDAMIANVKQLIASDPGTGARALGELALLYVSTETPHAYCRGFALSLWDEAVMGAPLPRKWLTSVETYLVDIAAAYPKIAGRVPRVFDQNYCVGPVVTSRDVPALLAHVEKTVEAMAPAERVRYRPLCEVLRVAAARGLGYWEGTDIDVVQTNEGWLASVRRPRVVTAPNPLSSAHARPLAVSGTRMLIGEHFVLHELDIGTFPPAAISHDDMQVTAAAFTPWGTEFIRMVTDRHVRPFKFGYFELPGRSPLAIEPEFAISIARPARDGVLLFPQATPEPRPGARPLVLRPPAALEPLDVPEPATSQRIDCDAIGFGDGSLLVIWDGVPYRWDGASPPVSLGGTLEATEDVCAAAVLSDGSIAGGFGRKLIRIDRGGQRASVLPLDNVIAVARGPGDALIITEGDNPEGDAVKLWWPATREVTHVPPRALELEDRPILVYFDAAEQLLVAARPGMWHALPWSELEAMRRVSADELAERRTELAARAPTSAE